MEINLKEIVGQVIDKMEKEKTIETMIEEALTNTIERAIKDSIGGYKVRDQIEDKLRNEVSTVLDKLDLKSFNSYIVKSINEIIVDDTKKDLKEKIDQELKLSLNLIELPEVMKLSDLLTKIQEFFDEELDYEQKDDIDFTLDLSLENLRRSLFSVSEENDIELKIGTDDDNIKMTLWHMNSDGEKVFRILSLYLNDNNIKNVLKEKGRLSEIELLLAKMQLQGVKIEIDVDEDDLSDYAHLTDPYD